MTRYLNIQPDSENAPGTPGFEAAMAEAGEVLRSGGLVAFPTETVYGLAAAAADPDAVTRLVEVKQRPDDKPFSYLLPDDSKVGLLVADIPRQAHQLIKRYWPGPLTLVLPTGDSPDDEDVGIRVTADPFAQAFLRAAETLAVVPSANPRDEAPATSADQVREYFDGKIDMVLDGGEVTLKQSSAVVRVSDDGVDVLREGIITSEMIDQLLSGKTILFVCTGNTCRSPMAEALFRKHLAAKLDRPEDDLHELGYRIVSAGLMAGYGGIASQGAADVMDERGCDLSNHSPRPLTRELVFDADRIYGMTSSHVEGVRMIAPEASEKVALLDDSSICDPIGGDLELYRSCADQIEDAVKRRVRNL